jgi:predicted nucleic acid-binding protein
MAFNPRECHGVLVADTCSVWNVLSSRRLFRSARAANRHFVITPVVLYECQQIVKREPNSQRTELLARFNAARSEGAFTAQGCEIEDLLAVSRSAPLGLSSGELSCMAVAYKVRTAFMTDDRQARRYAEQAMQLIVITTPKLYAWLHYHRHLLDSDHDDVVREHEQYERRPLSKFLREAYEVALQYRLMDQSSQ